MWTESYPAMEYRHGPISVAGQKSLVWTLGTVDPELTSDISATGATVVHQGFDPMAELVTIQRTAAALAKARKLDPDHPRYLTRSVTLIARLFISRDRLGWRDLATYLWLLFQVPGKNRRNNEAHCSYPAATHATERRGACGRMPDTRGETALERANRDAYLSEIEPLPRYWVPSFVHRFLGAEHQPIP